MGGPEWTLVVIVGPILLGLALIFAMIRNRRRTPRDEARTEEATHRLYEEESRRDEGNP